MSFGGLLQLIAYGNQVFDRKECGLHKSEIYTLSAWLKFVHFVYSDTTPRTKFKKYDFLKIKAEHRVRFKQRALDLSHAKLERTRLERQFFETPNNISRALPTELLCIIWKTIDTELKKKEEELKNIHFNSIF